MSWLYSQYLTFHWKLLVLVSRIQKSGTGDNNFGKWKGTFRSERPKWPDRSQWTTFKAGPEYFGRTKPKWSVPFDEPTEISGILGWMESALSFVILPLKFDTSPVVKKVSGQGRVYDSTSAAIKIPFDFKSHTKCEPCKGHTRGISSGIRRKPGGYSREFWIGVCREGSWTLTLFKD